MRKIKIQGVILCMSLLAFISCGTTVTQSESSLGEVQEQKEKERREDTGDRVLAINNPLPPGTIDLVEDFEDGMFWYADGISDDSDFSIGAELSDEWSTSGDASCVWSFARIPEGGAATWSCNNLPEKDFESVSYLLCDINNTSRESLSLCVGFETGDTHEKSTTEPVLIGVGENINVMFDLKHGIKDANGNSVYAVTDAFDVRVISFTVQGKARASSFGIDNIRVAR